MAVNLDKKGREIVDPTPANVSVRRQKMVSLSDQMRQVVTQMRHEAHQAEEDSAEDEKDFDLEDDEPRSPHELFVETEEYGMFLDDIAEFARVKKNVRSAPNKFASPPADHDDPPPLEASDGAQEAPKGKK